MAKSRPLPLASLRVLLLAGLGLFVAALLGLYLYGRAGRETSATKDGSVDAGGLLVEAEGFSYEITQEDRLIARIQGERMLSDRQEQVTLEGMEITVFRQEGGTYHVESETGTYHLRTHETLLEGGVVLASEDGTRLNTERLKYNGHVARARTPVTLRLRGGIAGSARGLVADLDREVFRLVGDVRLDRVAGEGEPLGLRAERVSYDEGKGAVWATGRVTVTRSRDVLQAARLNLLLTPDGRHLQFALARGNAGALLRRPTDVGLDRSVEVRGEELTFEFDPEAEQLRRLEATGRRGDPVTAESRDPEGLVRRLRAGGLDATFRGPSLAQVDAFGGVVVAEHLAPGQGPPLRRTCSERARLDFGPEGDVRRLVLRGQADYQEPGRQVSGARVEVSARGDAEVVGDPARVLTSQGELEAPRIVRAGGRIEAFDGVRARLDQGQGREEGVSLGGEKGPVRVESRTAVLHEEADRFVFQGGVRAWQAGSLLLSEQLEGRRRGEFLQASGGVKTIRRPGPGESGEGEPADSVPVEVTSERMTYDGPHRLLRYEGAARARQGGRELACNLIEIGLTEEGEAEDLTCTGAVRVSDDAAGRTVDGERAEYRFGEEGVVVEGQPAVLRDRDGTTIQGVRMVYDFKAGTARVESLPPAEGEEVTTSPDETGA